MCDTSLSENFAADCCQLARRWSDAARNSCRMPFGAAFHSARVSNSMYPYAPNNERRGDSDLPFHFSNKTRIQCRFRSKRLLAKFDGVIVYNRKQVLFGDGNALLQKPFADYSICGSTEEFSSEIQGFVSNDREISKMLCFETP